MILGIDTSNYTTSIAIVDQNGTIINDKRKLLKVKEGSLGLRQSEAFFQHINNLPDMFDDISLDYANIRAVSVSERPRNVNGSYMPCFRAGTSVARTISKVLNVPVCCFSHQQGHIRSALVLNEKIDNDSFVALHLSGGTTEILLCEKKKSTINSQIIGKTIDISAGQLIDRVGVMCKMKFPCGEAMDDLSTSTPLSDYKIAPSVRGADISFSGAEAQIKRDFNSIENKDIIIKAVFICICESLKKALNYVCDKENVSDVLFTGGVSESIFLRNYFALLNRNNLHFYFAKKGLSCDNAVGIALLGNDYYRENYEH